MLMVKRLSGTVESGCGDARNWGISEIQEITGYGKLQPGTLNVRLSSPYNVRSDYELLGENRKDGRRYENLRFEHCCLLIGPCRVPALIARTSTNYWESCVLELMSEEMLRERHGLKDGDMLHVEVWAGTEDRVEIEAWARSCGTPANRTST